MKDRPLVAVGGQCHYREVPLYPYVRTYLLNKQRLYHVGTPHLPSPIPPCICVFGRVIKDDGRTQWWQLTGHIIGWCYPGAVPHNIGSGPNLSPGQMLSSTCHVVPNAASSVASGVDTNVPQYSLTQHPTANGSQPITVQATYILCHKYNRLLVIHL